MSRRKASCRRTRLPALAKCSYPGAQAQLKPLSVLSHGAFAATVWLKSVLCHSGEKQMHRIDAASMVSLQAQILSPGRAFQVPQCMRLTHGL